MKFGEMKENDDGSVNVNIDFEEGEVEMLIQYAVTNLLKDMIEREDNNVTVD